MASLTLSMPIILASSSPRRQELLSQLGLIFHSISPNIDETLHNNETPEQYVQRLAHTKAEVIAQQYPDALVIAGDTSVSLDSQILGQASNKQQAFAIWQQLSGRWHDVFTGMCVCYQSQYLQQVVRTQVQFQTLNQQDMEMYWATGEPLGKAGAYAIQGIAGQFIPQIQGSYSNVVGLPLHETAMMLKHFQYQ